MVQLTSDAAIVPLYRVRSPRVNVFSIPSVPHEAFKCSSLCSPPLHSSSASFVCGPLFALGPSDVCLTTIRLTAATPCLSNRGRDFNPLENTPAGRVHCEYRAQERIHRNMADFRLLAIPASRGRVSDPDPN